MKAILLASGMTIVLALSVTAALRWRPTELRVRRMTKLFLLLSAVLAVLWRVTPDDLGFLPRDLLAEPRWLDGAATLFFFASAFFGGILQIYNLADRGFSLRILIDLDEGRVGAGNVRGVLDGYGGGRGLEWMYRKRVDGMLREGFVQRQADRLALTAKGRRTAAAFLALRRFARLEH